MRWLTARDASRSRRRAGAIQPSPSASQRGRHGDRRGSLLARAGHGQVDLREQEVRFDGRQVPFEIDHEIRHRLLGGLDDIALALLQEDAIAAYERDRERNGPVTTAL